MHRKPESHVDYSKIDIAKPIENKKFAITREAVITWLLILIVCLVVKIIILDGLLFNTSLELEIFQRDLAITIARMTRMPEQSIEFSRIDTTNIMTMFMQILEIFVVEPLLDYAEVLINHELDKVFQSI